MYGNEFETVWDYDAEETRTERMCSTASRREERYGEDAPSDSELRVADLPQTERLNFDIKVA